ncbi:MAG: glycosyltransferase family 39 protein [Dehalococcoidia bacterium]|nr:glycosyltransferase family 39 protein [Dehalococcoidia bacterium]
MPRFFDPETKLKAMVIALVLAGFGLRAFRLDNQSIWSDEGFSIWASKDLANISSLAASSDIHPPLYDWLLHFWILLAGSSEYATRFLSVFFGVAALAVIFQLGRSLLGRSGVAFTVLVAAVAPFLVYYSQETRMYSTALFFSLVSALAAIRWLRGSRSWAWLALYIVASTAATYTHYYTWLIFAFLNCIVLGWFWFAKPRYLTPLVAWALGQTAVAIAYVPWVGVLLTKYETYLTPVPGAGVTTILYQTLVSFGLSYSAGQAGAAPGHSDILPDHWIVFSVALAILAVAAIGLVSGRYTGSRQGRLERAFLLLYLTVPLAGIIVLSWGKRDFAPRHLFFAAPAYYLLIGAGLAAAFRSRKTLGVLALILILGSSGLSLRNYYFDSTYWRDDIRGMAQFINSRVREGDTVVLNASYMSPAFGYYYQDNAPVIGVPTGTPPDWDQEIATLQEVTNHSDRVWLVLWQDYFTDPEHKVQRWLEKNAIFFQQRGFRGLINVLGFVTRPPVLAEIPGGESAKLPIGSTVEMAGYQLPSSPICSGEEMDFTLYWRALQPLQKDYTVFVHLDDGGGRTWGQADSQPLGGGFPTTRWPVGSIIADERWLKIPADTPPGEYHLVVGMYDFATMKRLGDGDSGPSQQSTGPFRVGPMASESRASLIHGAVSSCGAP